MDVVYVTLALGVVILLVTIQSFGSTNAANEKLHRYLLVAVPLAVICFILLYSYSQHERRGINYKRGREGEDQVLKVLKELPEEYIVYADGIIDYGNIDFAVLKENTLFNIEVKSHKGRISTNGWQLTRGGRKFPYTDPIYQALQNEKKFVHFLTKHQLPKYNIISVIVFSNPAAYVDVSEVIRDVHVVHNRVLRKFIEEYNI